VRGHEGSDLLVRLPGLDHVSTDGFLADMRATGASAARDAPRAFRKASSKRGGAGAIRAVSPALSVPCPRRCIPGQTRRRTGPGSPVRTRVGQGGAARRGGCRDVPDWKPAATGSGQFPGGPEKSVRPSESTAPRRSLGLVRYDVLHRPRCRPRQFPHMRHNSRREMGSTPTSARPGDAVRDGGSGRGQAQLLLHASDSRPARRW
jgi:hypothetical protein